MEDLLLDSEAWRVNGKSFEVSVDDGVSGTRTYFISEETVNQCHPLLSDAIRGLVSWHEEFGEEPYATRAQVWASLENLKAEPYSFTGPLNERYVFGEIIEISVNPHFSDYLRMYGRRVNIWTASKELQSAQFVTTSVNEAVDIDKAYLNRCFPGWEQRWAIGHELGIEHKALMHHIFASRPVPPAQSNVAVESITFE